MGNYIMALDAGTTSNRAILFNHEGKIVSVVQKEFTQIYPQPGWVEHDANEIWSTMLGVAVEAMAKVGVSASDVAAIGITNQRETTIVWDKNTGEPVYNAIVWQCARAAGICERHQAEAEEIRQKTGMTLSPYFPASKLQWIMENVPEAGELAKEGKLCVGTMDVWLIWNLTKDHAFRTDYSNASRTQLFNIHTLRWDEELLAAFGIPAEALPEVCMSDSVFGYTDLEGLLPREIPICGVLGDSHGALFGQNCRYPGQLKATYGTGSSVMMNIGTEPKLSESGLVTSLAWGRDGKVEYVFEGNLNYTGAVITWLKEELGLIENPGETAALAEKARKEDRTYFVPAFTGLGSPYWDPDATGMFTGITRTTGRNEMVKACVECIAYQITDLIDLMRKDTELSVPVIRVDGGPTANEYLMQFQSDMADCKVQIPQLQELSGMGAAYMAGISTGIYDPQRIFDSIAYTEYEPRMTGEIREEKYRGWKNAVKQVLLHE